MMWLKMYLGNVYVDKAEIDFESMETQGERKRHLEGLARDMKAQNYLEILRSGITPVFYIQVFSSMCNTGFKSPTWWQIIRRVGSEQAKKNIEAMAKKLSKPNEI